MALRAFRDNPSLGGFGGGAGVELETRSLIPSKRKDGGLDKVKGAKYTLLNTTADDSFAQIVKELVDNAVDACYIAERQQQQALPPTSQADRKGQRKGKQDKGDPTSQQPLLHRVRIVIQPESPHKPCSTSKNAEEILRVTVTDNGCGMNNIQDCVRAFHTSKAADASTGNKRQQQTAGRYGMGLTLCLLHAQRIVGSSCAVITSATPSQKNWTRAKYVVDAENDDIICVFEETKKKQSPMESGTAVSVLLPGGPAASRAWPRLAEYFARFYLSLEIKCSMEVLAPTLAPMPLFIRPPAEDSLLHSKNSQSDNSDQDTRFVNNIQVTPFEEKKNDCSSSDGGEDSLWQDAFISATPRKHELTQRIVGRPTSSPKESSSDDDVESNYNDDDSITSQQNSSGGTKWQISTANNRKIRESLRKAVRAYLCQPVDIRNVAHSLQPIRRVSATAEYNNRGNEFTLGGNIHRKRKTPPSRSNSDSNSIPLLEVDMIIFDDEQEDDFKFHHENESDRSYESLLSKDTARLVLIRLVNRVPILDGAEAYACGIVRGIASKQKVWNSFGLDIDTMNSATSVSNNNESTEEAFSQEYKTKFFVPEYTLKDSSQVAPYFRQQNTKTNNHHLYEGNRDESSCSSDDSRSSDVSCSSNDIKRTSKKRKENKLLPAGARLGNILIIVHIYANPSALPMPTLSKGRLPLGDPAIDTALEFGIKSCLKSLQSTNPSLFLSPAQLRETEQDVIHFPEIASSMASIIISSPNIDTFSRSATRIVTEWQNAAAPDRNIRGSNTSALTQGEEQLQELIENRLRAVRSLAPRYRKEQTATASEKNMSKRQTRSCTAGVAVTAASPASSATEIYEYINMDDLTPGKNHGSSVEDASDVSLLEEENCSSSADQKPAWTAEANQNDGDDDDGSEWW